MTAEQKKKIETLKTQKSKVKSDEIKQSIDEKINLVNKAFTK